MAQEQVPWGARATIWIVFAAAAAIAAIWSLHAGKDLSWDLLHYHYYAAHAFLEGRLERDFFAASAQGYLNPLGFVPFYWMVSSGWHSVAVSTVLAAAHAANIALLYALAQRLFVRHEERNRATLSLLAAALGAASAVFWATVGTSFLDPLLTVPMLGGLLLLTGEAGAGRTSRVGWAGFLFGAAAALKYSNALFGLAAAILALSLPGSRGSARLRALLAYAAGGVVGLALFGGATFVHLYREYGNPVFPLLNAWFRSPDFPPLNIGAERFAPKYFDEAMFFPFRIMSPESLIYAEISAPDLRFAALIALAGAVAVATIWRRGGSSLAPGATLTTLDFRLLGFFALAYAAWLATSANARYGMLLILLVGLLVARCVDLLLPVAAARGTVVVLLVAQTVACALISPTRWFLSDLWSERWFSYQAPERARREPALYLSVETQAMSVVVPLLHPESSFVNLRGQHSLQHGARRMQALIARHHGRVRTIGRALRLQRDGKPRPGIVEAYDSTLLRFGFRVDPDDCFAIAWRPDRGDALSQFANLIATGDAGVQAPNAALVSCALGPGSWSAAVIEEERRISALFDRVERSCQGIFRDQTAVTERLGAEWSRSYAGLEARLETNQGAMILVPYFRLRNFYLGTAAEWESGVPGALEKPCREGLPR